MRSRIFAFIVAIGISCYVLYHSEPDFSSWAVVSNAEEESSYQDEKRMEKESESELSNVDALEEAEDDGDTNYNAVPSKTNETTDNPPIGPELPPTRVRVKRTFKSQPYNNFCVFPNVYKTSHRAFKLPMILHTSANYFGENLVKMADTWDGRISLAIHSNPDLQEKSNNSAGVKNTIKKVYRLVHCFPSVRDSLSAHIFITNIFEDEECPTLTLDITESNSCEHIHLSKFKFRTPGNLYPVNPGRNMARIFDNSEYFLFADMEQEYSDLAEEKLRNLVKKHNIRENKRLITIRRFEHYGATKSPRTMGELQSRFKKSVFVFHSFFWPLGHRIRDLSEWLKYRGDDFITTVEIKTLKTHFWEPMFVAHRSIPFHDERLVYGKENHVALALHLCCAGYKFAIAPEVFNSHQGVHKYPIIRTFGANGWSLAKRALKAFYLDMATEFPETSKYCLKGRHPRRWKTVNATVGPPLDYESYTSQEEEDD